MPFLEAEDEIRAIYRTEISEPTIRRTTHQNGQASEAVERQAVEEIEATALAVLQGHYDGRENTWRCPNNGLAGLFYMSK
jgi:hypothetical protein